MSHNYNIPRWFTLTAGTFIAFIVFYLFVTQETIAQTTTSSERVTVSRNDKRGKVSLKRSGLFESFEIEYEGKIEVTDNDEDIKSISPGGFIEISKTTFGSRRKIIVENKGRGLEKKYYEGRSSRPFEPEGKEWLAEILPDIVRSTRVAAQSRVDRYFRKDGVDGVLEEIERLKGDYVKIHYANLLIGKSGLKDSDLITIINDISREVDSDYYLSQFFKKSSRKYLSNERLAEAYFSNAAEIDSDYYLSVVLKDALEDQNYSPQVMSKVVVALNNMDSDYYQTVVVSSLLDNEDLDSETLRLVVSSSRNVSSDYYQSSVLKKALEHKNLNDEALNVLLEEIGNVSSDYYITTVFGDLLERDLSADTKVKIVNTIARNMDSDYYASVLLSKVFERGEVNEDLSKAAIYALRDIDSDYYASSVISTASKNTYLDKKGVKSLIEATTYIDSDYYQSVALSDLADLVNRLNDSELKEAYLQAAKRINSDTYYGRTLKALN